MKKAASGIAIISLMIGLYSAPVFAGPIVFNLGVGGTVSYGGGSSPFMTVDGAVNSASNGVTTVDIVGGDLDFETGLYAGGITTDTGFENWFAAGGSLTIWGDIGPGSALILEGAFADSSIFNCCSGSSPLFTSSFSGLLDITDVDPGLALLLDFKLPPTGGSIAQVQIFFW